jgi:class 3 adenylate cyclase
MDPETLGLTEIIKLQTQLSEVLKRRFEKSLALAFSDIVGSTNYFAIYGDEAGRRMQQLHFDQIAKAVPSHGGRVIDTAGDGAFLTFPTSTQAALALIELQQTIARQNVVQARDHQLEVRLGIHWGPVLTDGAVVTGDSVNLCSRVTTSAGGGEIRLSKAAYSELSKELRLRCVGLPPAMLKGVVKPVEMMRLEWRDKNRFPTRVRIKETGDEIALPHQDTITFGRLREQNGIVANDIVLAVADKAITQLVSRWHFELRRYPDGFKLRSVTDQATAVDGQPVMRGDEVPMTPNSVVRVNNVMTLEFLPDPAADGDNETSDATGFATLE